MNQHTGRTWGLFRMIPSKARTNSRFGINFPAEYLHICVGRHVGIGHGRNLGLSHGFKTLFKAERKEDSIRMAEMWQAGSSGGESE